MKYEDYRPQVQPVDARTGQFEEERWVEAVRGLFRGLREVSEMSDQILSDAGETRRSFWNLDEAEIMPGTFVEDVTRVLGRIVGLVDSPAAIRAMGEEALANGGGSDRMTEEAAPWLVKHCIASDPRGNHDLLVDAIEKERELMLEVLSEWGFLDDVRRADPDYFEMLPWEKLRPLPGWAPGDWPHMP